MYGEFEWGGGARPRQSGFIILVCRNAEYAPRPGRGPGFKRSQRLYRYNVAFPY
jgi:hypothetical protein